MPGLTPPHGFAPLSASPGLPAVAPGGAAVPGATTPGVPGVTAQGGHRPPAPGHPVRLADGPPYEAGALFLVTYEDEEYAFEEGAWGRFGRDDEG